MPILLISENGLWRPQNLTKTLKWVLSMKNEFKKNLTFSNLLFFNFFLKNVPILKFLSIFYDFWLYFAFDAKIKVYKRYLWFRWFFGMKVHYIRSVYSKYLFENLSKSIFEFFFSTADIICMIITDIPLKNVTSEKMSLGVWISHQIIPAMPRWFDEKISKIRLQNQKLHFF